MWGATTTVWTVRPLAASRAWALFTPAARRSMNAGGGDLPSSAARACQACAAWDGRSGGQAVLAHTRNARPARRRASVCCALQSSTSTPSQSNTQASQPVPRRSRRSCRGGSTTVRPHDTAARRGQAATRPGVVHSGVVHHPLRRRRQRLQRLLRVPPVVVACRHQGWLRHRLLHSPRAAWPHPARRPAAGREGSRPGGAQHRHRCRLAGLLQTQASACSAVPPAWRAPPPHRQAPLPRCDHVRAGTGQGALQRRSRGAGAEEAAPRQALSAASRHAISCWLHVTLRTLNPPHTQGTRDGATTLPRTPRWILTRELPPLNGAPPCTPPQHACRAYLSR